MAARSHLSIGEVLSLLREEFPDITISKIRFLESQGLVDPERTPSGYRKFYDHDVERLRWILRQQRENFLPLKVIKGRLSEQEPEGTEVLSAEQLAWEAAATGAAARAGTPPATSTPPATAATDAAPGAGAPPSAGPGGPADEQHRHAAPDESLASAESASPATPAAPPAGRPGSQRDATQPEPNPARPEATPATPSPAAPLATPAPSPSPARPAVPPAAVEPTEGRKHATEPVRPPNQGPAGDVDSYTAAELAAAAGADLSTVKELQGFGLLQPQAGSGGTAYFDAEGLEVLRLAAAFARHGVEARHLRAWKTSAEREASLFEQVIMPLLHQRNPQARRQAGETLEELAGLGAELRAALVRHALRSIR